MAVIGIYRLLSVEEICETKEVQESMTNHTKEMEQKRSRTIRSTSDTHDDAAVVARDASLEETHEENLKREKLTTTTALKQTEPHPSTETATSKTNNVQDATSPRKLESKKSAEKAELRASTGNPMKSTVKEPLSTADSTVNSIVSKSLSNTDSPIATIANSSEEFDSDDENKTSTFMMEATKSSVKATTMIEKTETNATNDVKNTRVLKSTINKVADKVLRTATKRVRLVKRAFKCLPIGGRVILGIGDVDVPYVASLCVPFVCLILSIMIVCFSITHAFVDFSKPARHNIFLENVAQSLLWTFSGITLLLTRLDWRLTWNGAMPGVFVPEYPDSWYWTEVVECPENENSVYMSTAELSEEIVSWQRTV
ncbi:hypothetical protein KIN20_033752 [Parelaphostrongylus tenuis]|uniref:Uncharacterized protein n=1 Tax=Parelaphostrongylus tenuis TaxID=148309 RepID=A0AAD5WJ48_PARTN|nr:hypothetical protein KIN20_033752 [Parelaphostrongylus tenuis]